MGAPAQGAAPDDAPVFDWTRVSYRWARDFAAAQASLGAALRDGDAARLAGSTTARDALLVQPLATVPRAWLVDGAPDVLDWGDPASLDWLQAPKVAALVRALLAAQSDAAKA